MRSICCSLPNEIQSFSLHDKLKPGISADVKRVLGVLATMTPPGPTLSSSSFYCSYRNKT